MLDIDKYSSEIVSAKYSSKLEDLSKSLAEKINSAYKEIYGVPSSKIDVEILASWNRKKSYYSQTRWEYDIIISKLDFANKKERISKYELTCSVEYDKEYSDKKNAWVYDYEYAEVNEISLDGDSRIDEESIHTHPSISKALDKVRILYLFQYALVSDTSKQSRAIRKIVLEDLSNLSMSVTKLWNKSEEEYLNR